MAHTFKRSVVAVNIASLLFYNMAGMAATSQPTHTLQASDHSAIVDAAAQAWLRLKAPRYKTMLQDSAASPTSNAFNFKSLYGSSVDTRTGSLTFHFVVGTLTGNNGLGPNLKLMVQYNQNSQDDPYGLGKGWSFNLPHYDPHTQNMTFASGASFRITNIDGAGLKNLQYQKLKVTKVYQGGANDPYFLKTIDKQGQINYFDAAGYITQMQSPRGDNLIFVYDISSGGHILTAIKDGHGKQLTFERVGGGYHIISQDDLGQAVTTALTTSNGLLTNITLPVIGKSIDIGYSALGTQQLITSVHYPTGSWDSFQYKKLSGPEIAGHPAFYSYAVSQHISHAQFGSAENDQITSYDYNVVPGHNYLGHGANVPYSATEDLLFGAPQSYRYGTKVSDGQSTITTMYNKFHLQTEQTIANSQGKVLQQSQQCYAIDASSGMVCGDQPVTAKITDANPAYTLPVQTSTSYFAPVSIRHKGLLAADGPRVVTTKSTYDDQGNLLTQTDPMGMQVVNTYGDPNANGFVNDKLSSMVTPANVGQPHAPMAVKATYTYIKLDPQHSGPVAKLSLPKQIISRYETANKQWQAFRQRTNHYYGEQHFGNLKAMAADPNYSLVKGAEVTLLTPQSHTITLQAAPPIQQQARQFLYKQDQSITINGKTYQVTQQKTQQGGAASLHNGQLRAAPARTFTTYTSTYTHRPLLQVDAKGHKTAFVYDGLGREVQAIANYGESTQATKKFSYTVGANNNAIITTLPNGYQTRVVRDGLNREIGRYVEHLDADGKAVPGQWDKVLTTTYDQYGNKASVTHYDTDGNGKQIALTTYYQYDAQHRLTVVSYPDGTAQVTFYDDNAIAPDGSQVGRVITYGLVNNGQAVTPHGAPSPCRIGDTYYGATLATLTVVDRNAKNQEVHRYQLLGDPKAYSGNLASQLTQNIGFLAKGLALNPAWLPAWVSEVVQAKAYYTMTSNTYDGDSRLLTHTDVNGHVTRNVYDQSSTGYTSPGNLLETISPNGHTKLFHYGINAVDQVSAMVQGKPMTLGTRALDGDGHVLWQRDPLGNTYHYQYDNNGNATKITTPNGQVIDQTYNSMNKMTKRSVESDAAGLYTTTWTYDDQTGQVTKRVDATGTTTYQYNAAGLLIAVVHTTDGSQPTQAQSAYALKFGYTLSGEIAWMQDASGEKATYHYIDEGQHAGKLDTVTANGQVVHYHYNPDGSLAQVIYPNGMQTTYGYDQATKRLINLVHEQTKPNKKIITAFAYSYYPDGNIKTRTRTDGQSQQAQESYTYDQDNNLLSYQCQGGLCPQDQKHNRILGQQYTFDDVNNISSVVSKLQDSQGKTLSNTTTYTYSDVSPTRLVKYENSLPSYGAGSTLGYDKDGNIVQDGQNQLLRYDPLDRMVSLIEAGSETPQITYIYNGDNVQIGQVPAGKSATYYVYGQGQLLNSEQDSHFTRYIYGAKRLAQVDKDTLTYYLTDQAQSVVNMVGSKNGQPQVLAAYAYSPYGIESSLIQPKAQGPLKRFGFDGQLTDSTSGWQLMGQGYRAYNPMIKRFMRHDSESPFGKGGINGYNFASNNPIANYDPTGHSTLGIILGSLGIVASTLGTILSLGTATPELSFSFAASVAGIAAGVSSDVTGGLSLYYTQSHDIADQKIGDKLILASGILGIFSLATGLGPIVMAARGAGKLVAEDASLAKAVTQAQREVDGVNDEMQPIQVFQGSITQNQELLERNTFLESKLVGKQNALTEANTAQQAFRDKYGFSEEITSRWQAFKVTYGGAWRVHGGGVAGGALFLGAAGGLSGGLVGALSHGKTHVDPLPPPPPPPPAPAPSGVSQGDSQGSTPSVMTTGSLPPLPNLDGDAIRS